MSDEYIEITQKGQLKDAINTTKICVLLALVQGRDAVNASSTEEFEECLESKKRDFRTFVKITGSDFKDELKDIGVDMGAEPFPKFVVFADGQPRCVEDVTDESLGDLIGKFGRA